MARKKTDDPEALFWLLAEELMQRNARVCEGTLMNGRCLRVGREFLALYARSDSAMVVKLPRARVEALIESGHGRPFAPAGRVFKEWLAVPKPDPKRWAALLQEGVAFVQEGV